MSYFPILLIIINLYGGVGMASFESMAACEVAREQITEVYKMRAYCVDRRSN